MFDLSIQFMTEFVSLIPVGIVVILVFNLIADLLWRN
jgi:hypothetical protein